MAIVVSYSASSSSNNNRYQKKIYIYQTLYSFRTASNRTCIRVLIAASPSNSEKRREKEKKGMANINCNSNLFPFFFEMSLENLSKDCRTKQQLQQIEPRKKRPSLYVLVHTCIYDTVLCNKWDLKTFSHYMFSFPFSSMYLYKYMCKLY